MLLLTAMTCQVPYWTTRNLIFENRTNDTIFLLVGSGKPFNPAEVIEMYEDEWASLILPNGYSTESMLDAEERIVYCALLKKQTLDNHSKEEIIERDLVEYYSYSYQDLKKIDFKIVYSGENPTDSAPATSM